MPAKKEVPQKDIIKKILMLSASILLALASVFAIIGMVIVLGGQIRYSDSTQYISGEGEGVVELSPDMADIVFAVEHTADSVAEAQDAVTATLANIVEGLGTLGLAPEDVKTQDYESQPQYEQKRPADCADGNTCPAQEVLMGYSLHHSVRVTVRDIAIVDDVLAALADANVTEMSGPNFRTENTDQARNEARNIAIKKAQIEAEQTATALGLELRKMIDYTDMGDYDEWYGAEVYLEETGLALEEEPATPEVPAGQETVTVNVSLTYKAR